MNGRGLESGKVRTHLGYVPTGARDVNRRRESPTLLRLSLFGVLEMGRE
jgi:hypothetical protein